MEISFGSFGMKNICSTIEVRVSHSPFHAVLVANWAAVSKSQYTICTEHYKKQKGIHTLASKVTSLVISQLLSYFDRPFARRLKKKDVTITCDESSAKVQLENACAE